MILKKLELTNFRQFCGYHSVIFSNGKKNVTIVYGENGRGKTGLFRALIFALYGKKKLTQDGSIDEKELFLVNKSAIEKNEIAGETSTISKVQIEFSHSDHEYLINREIKAAKIGGKIIEQYGECKLVKKLPDGNSKIFKDPDDINKEINTILDERVKEYFLFDGEKIEKLTRADIEQRKAVSNGIKDLLNIDTLSKAIDAMSKLVSSLRIELAKQCPIEYSKILKDLDEIAVKLKEREEIIENKRDELDKANAEITQIDKKLDGIKEIRHLLEIRKTLIEKENSLENELQNSLLEIRSKLPNAGYLLISKTVKKIFKNLDEQVERGEIPPELKAEFVDKLIQMSKCICGREIKIDSAELKELESWKLSVANGEIKRDALKIWQNLTTITRRLDTYSSELHTSLQRYAGIKHDLLHTGIEMEALSEKIGSEGDREDISNLENLRKNNEKRIIDLKLQEDKLNGEIQNFKQQELNLKAQLIEKEKELRIKNVIADRMKLAEKSHEALKNIYKEFTTEIKKELSKSASAIFKTLIDEEGNKYLDKIVVDDDYSLQIYDRWDKPFLANISAGQRQIMSIAFIVALAKAASGNKDIFEMPLFMDTPFGRLSNSHRKSLIQNLPKLCPQWVLLATDTEFRRTEREMFRENEKLGSFWHLKSSGNDGTSIIKIKDDLIDTCISD